MSLADVKKNILASKKIGITYHVSPDGDAVGSALALYQGLLKLNKDVYMISKDELGEYLKFLPSSNVVDSTIIEPIHGTDLVIGVDCGNLERLSANLEYYSGKIANIDHHISNDYYGDINYVDTSAAATAEIIYGLLNEMKIALDINISTCLYTSLVTDTGAFRHSNVTERTLAIASKLKSFGVNNTDIYTQLFDNKEFEALKTMGLALSKMELMFDNKVSIITMDSTFGELGDSSEVVGYGLKIKGVEVALLIRETEKGVKASLRSKNNVDVRKIAEALGGGGHIKASGITFKDMSLEDAKCKLLRIIEDELKIWTE